MNLFTSRQPFTSLLDQHLIDAKVSLNWFQAWKASVKSDPGWTKREKRRALPSWESLEDLDSAVIGFEQLVNVHLTKFPGSAIRPGQINTDIVENVFCPQRAVHNGSCTHPNHYQYCYTINTILLCAGLCKGTSNAGDNNTAAQPFGYTTHRPLNPRKK